MATKRFELHFWTRTSKLEGMARRWFYDLDSFFFLVHNAPVLQVYEYSIHSPFSNEMVELVRMLLKSCSNREFSRFSFIVIFHAFHIIASWFRCFVVGASESLAEDAKLVCACWIFSFSFFIFKPCTYFTYLWSPTCLHIVYYVHRQI